MASPMDTVFTIGFFGGLLVTLYGMITFFTTMQYEDTRPFSGYVTRTRKRKDGCRKLETYHTRGPRVVKATASKKSERTIWIGLIIWIGSWIASALS